MIGSYYSLDYQVHSFCSHDGQASIRDHCLRALEIGLDEIGFSEHKDFDPVDPAVNHFQYDEYRSQIEQARAMFRGALVIRMGVEIDYQRWFEEEIARFLDRHEFDYVIGSVHYVDSAVLMTDRYLVNRSPGQAYRDYFEALIHSVESGLIDIVGHMEYANRRGIAACGPYDPAPYREEIERLFRAMMERTVALEINTAGIRQGVGATYPCAQHVGLYAERGGRLLCFGSDAHHPDDLAADFSTAMQIAQDSGLESVTIWEDRRPCPRTLRAGGA